MDRHSYKFNKQANQYNNVRSILTRPYKWFVRLLFMLCLAAPLTGYAIELTELTAKFNELFGKSNFVNSKDQTRLKGLSLVFAKKLLDLHTTNSAIHDDSQMILAVVQLVHYHIVPHINAGYPFTQADLEMLVENAIPTLFNAAYASKSLAAYKPPLLPNPPVNPQYFHSGPPMLAHAPPPPAHWQSTPVYGPPGVVQHGIVQHGVVQHGVVQHGVVQHGGAAAVSSENIVVAVSLSELQEQSIILGMQEQKIKDQIRDFGKILEKEEGKLRNMREERNRSLDRLQAARKKEKKLNWQLKNATSSSSKSINEQARQQQPKQEAKVKALEANLKQQDAMIKQQQQHVDKLSGQVQQAQKEKKQAIENQEELRQEIAQRNERIKELEQKMGDLTQQYEEAEKKVIKTQQREQQLDQDVRVLEKIRRSAEKANKSAIKKRQQAAAKGKALDNQQKELDRQQRKLEQEKDALTADKQAMEQRRQLQAKQQQELVQEVVNTQARMKEMRQKLQEMQDELQQLKQQKEAVAASVQAAPVLRLKLPSPGPKLVEMTAGLQKDELLSDNTEEPQTSELTKPTPEIVAVEAGPPEPVLAGTPALKEHVDQMLAENVVAMQVTGWEGNLMPEGGPPAGQLNGMKGDALRNIGIAEGAANARIMRRFRQFPLIAALGVSATMTVGGLAYFIQRLYRQPYAELTHEARKSVSDKAKTGQAQESRAEPLSTEVTKLEAQDAQGIVESPAMEEVSEEPVGSEKIDDQDDFFTTSAIAADADADADANEECGVITGQALRVFCRNTLEAERRKNLILLWQVRSQLLVVRYALRTLKGHLLEVSNPSLPRSLSEPDRQSVLLAESQVLFSDLTESEQLQLFELVSRLPLADGSLLHQVQTLQVLGRECGLMPLYFADQCLQQFDRNQVELSLRRLGVLPAHSFELEFALNRPDRFVILPVWGVDDERRHLTQKCVLPVHKVGGVLQLVRSEQASRKNWVVPETASYRTLTFTPEQRWKSGKSIATHQAGQKVRLQSSSDSVVIFGHQMNPYAGVYANRNGRVMEYGWLRDGRLSESALNLLWSLFEQSPEYNNDHNNAGAGEVMKWLALEYGLRLLVPEQRFNSHKMYEPADRQRHYARQEKGAVMPHFYPTAAWRYFDEFEQSQTWQWVRLLAFVYRASGLQAKGVGGREYFNQAAHLCGVFPAQYPLYQLSCFLHVAELSEWRSGDGLTLYLETIQSMRAGKSEGLAVLPLWPVSGSGSLLRPRFVPAVINEQDWRIMTRQKSARTVERALNIATGQYKLYQLNPDFTLSRVDTLDISSDKAIYKVPAGSSIVVRKGGDSNPLFIHHPFSAFRLEPYPLFTSARFLYGVENTYPIAHFNLLRKEMEIEPFHKISNFEYGIYRCQTMLSGNFREACETLINNGEYRAADVLVSMMFRFGLHRLGVPVFCLNDSYETGKKPESEDALVNGKVFQRSLARIRKEPAREGEPRILKLSPCEVRYGNSLPATWIVSTLREYLHAMDRYHLYHGQVRLYYLLLSHCGLLGESFRRQCTDRLLTLSAAQDSVVGPADREAYLKSSYELSRKLIVTRATEGKHGMMLVNWHFDEQLDLQSTPSYRVSFIDFGAPVPVLETAVLKDCEGDWRVPVVLTGLVPEKTYHLWRYDTSTGTWVDSHINPAKFRVPKHLAVIELPLVANWIYGLAEEGELAPTSFHYFMLGDLPESVRRSNSHMQSKLQPMPQPLWEQNIRLLPRAYWQKHGAH